MKLDKNETSKEQEVNDTIRTDLVSRRSRYVTDNPSFLFKWLQYAASNPYSKEENPEGVINLGTAENKLCEDLLVEKLSHPDVNQTEGFMNYYFTHCGDISFRTALKTFLEEKFHPCVPLDPENIIAACGCGAILDMLGFVLGEENDYFLSATPYYPRISNNLGERGRIRIYEVPLSSQLQSGDTAPFQLTAQKLETAYHQATKEGKGIRGVVLINPNNPLGDVYSEQQLRDILHFAARYQLHVLCDEIYALSTFDEKSQFNSILSVNDMPDPDRVYFIWGFSKDFALAGYRCGLLYTTNQEVLDYCKVVSYYQSVAMCVQIRLQNLISDKEWREGVYFPTNLQRMRSHFELCKTRLAAMGVPMHPSKGGLFVWINMRKYLGENVTFEEETKLFEELIQNGVYCVPGRSMRCNEPGWFRLVFTVTIDELTAGLTRVEKTILMRSQTDYNSKVDDVINETIHVHHRGDISCVSTQLNDTHITTNTHSKNVFVQTTTNPGDKLIEGHTNGSKPSNPDQILVTAVSEAKPHSVHNSHKTTSLNWHTVKGIQTGTQNCHVHTHHKTPDENKVDLINKFQPDENLIGGNQNKEKKHIFKRLTRLFRGKISTRHEMNLEPSGHGSVSSLSRRTKSEQDLLHVSFKYVVTQ